MCIEQDKDLENYFRSLDEPTDTSSTGPARAPKPVEEHEKFPCTNCAGTGLYQGVRLHQHKTQCFACKGRGWFKKSWADRQKAKDQYQAKKQAKLEDRKGGFNETNPGLIEDLKKIAGWHSFARSLTENFEKWGSLTEGQVRAARNALQKVAEKQAVRKAEVAAKTGEVSVETIEAMFQKAKDNGLKRPKFLTERLVIALAPDTGKNAGALYVKCDGTYAGKIQNGRLHPLASAPQDILQLVREVAASPLEAARLYGRKTGVCSCCARELTDPKSIAAGIGPICESKWGF